MRKWICRATLLATLTVVAPCQAWAIDIDLDDFVSRFNSPAGLNLGPISVVGEKVLVDGMTYQLDGSLIVLDGQFTFMGIVAQPDGGYLIDGMTAPDVVVRDAETREENLSLKDLAVSGYVVVGKPGWPTSITPMALSTGAVFTDWLGVPLTAGGVSMSLEPTFTGNDVSALTAEWAAEAIVLDLTTEAGVQTIAGQILADMDVDILTMDFGQSFVWSDDGGVALSARFAMRDLGAIQFIQHFNGMTRNKVRELMASLATASEQSGTIDMSFLAMAVGMTIKDSAVRYDDNSLLPKIIDYMALNLGGRERAVAEIESYLMAVVNQRGIAELSSLVRPALHEFLEQPSSLEMRFAPETPVSLIAFSVASNMNPAGLISLLGVTVAANEPPRPDTP